jgi:hypothetical protein
MQSEYFWELLLVGWFAFIGLIVYLEIRIVRHLPRHYRGIYRVEEDTVSTRGANNLEG